MCLARDALKVYGCLHPMNSELLKWHKTGKGGGILKSRVASSKGHKEMFFPIGCKTKYCLSQVRKSSLDMSRHPSQT